MSSGKLPLISLVIPTLGNRPAELERFLNCLQQQVEKNFETIIVDQSPDGLDNLLMQYKDSFKVFQNISDSENLASTGEVYQPTLLHIRSKRRGLSYNRNLGLNHVQAPLVAFLDDDNVILPDYTQIACKCLSLFSGTRAFAFGSVLRLENHQPFHPNYKVGSIRQLNRFNCEKISSIALIFAHQVFEKTGPFDEDFGVGADYGAAEEIDLMLRLLDAGYQAVYLPDLFLYHPAPPPVGNQLNPRYQSYAYAIGALARKRWSYQHDCQFPLVFLYSLIRSFGGAFLAGMRLNFATFRQHIQIFKTKCHGFAEYHPSGKLETHR